MSPPGPVPSWRPGQLVWGDADTKLVAVAGVGSRSGDAERRFSGLMRFLARQGYRASHDLLEGTYRGSLVDGRWEPRAYAPPDTRQPLSESAEAFASALTWYRDALPGDTRLWVLGYSLGGVVAFDGATIAVAADRAGWQGRLAGVITLAAPLRGCNAGPLINWAWLVTAELDPLGLAGPDLDRRWSDPVEQARVERRATFLRSMGARVLTLADPDDAVVRPDEALLPAPGETLADLLVRAGTVQPGSYGHGAILDEPAGWRRIGAALGPQRLRHGEAAGGGGSAEPRANAAIEQELKELKERLRAAGRLRS